MTGCTVSRCEQFETSPETIEQELRPAFCEHRQRDIYNIRRINTPITVQNFRDALLTQIGDSLLVEKTKVDAEHKTWARPATGYGGALLGKTACSTGYGVIIIRLLKSKKVC